MIASERGYKDIARYLILKGADKDIKNELGYTAMILAAEMGKVIKIW